MRCGRLAAATTTNICNVTIPIVVRSHLRTKLLTIRNIDAFVLRTTRARLPVRVGAATTSLIGPRGGTTVHGVPTLFVLRTTRARLPVRVGAVTTSLIGLRGGASVHGGPTLFVLRTARARLPMKVESTGH